MLLDTYLPIAIYIVIALAIPVIAFWLNDLFRPTKHTALKGETYECGEAPIGEAQVQFHFQYYMYAIIFVVFDVIAVFLLIWALNFDAFASVSSKIIMLAFFALMLVGAFYALRKEDKIWI
ncbi:MAG: NADH-quinone oxidoreductase subunit A [Euryarchaeota archaeon]|nr:NADH-quinone oxidoreductase subunit A [Euryarchaeota archaeon]